MMDYTKYYLLEDYLFGELKDNFKKRGYLTPEEFFCIVIWKSNRAKTKIRNRLLKMQSGNLAEIIRKITKDISNAPDDFSKLEILIKKWKFYLPMATAILTVLYPERFTIYDIRVRGQIKMKDFSGRKDQIEKYFSEFLPKIKQFSNGKNLRNNDKYLWGKSFYQDLELFLQK